MDTLQKFCRKHKVGIRKRLEAPHDISMEAQKVAWERLQLKERFHIDISEGFMYDPSKLRARYLFCQMTKRSSGQSTTADPAIILPANTAECSRCRLRTVKDGVEASSYRQ